MKHWMLTISCVPLLAGCFQDTASHILGPRDHAITVVRSQTWPWQSTVEASIIVVRMPECQGGGPIQEVPEDADYELYRAPQGYAEPMFMLKVDQRVFAVSTQSCRVQEFHQHPDELGERLGAFKVKDGKFQFVQAGI